MRFTARLLFGTVLLVLQMSVFSSLSHHLFSGIFADIKFNFLFLLAVYEGFYKDLGEGLLYVFLLGLIAGIFSPFFFSFFPAYTVFVFMTAFIASRIFLVRKSILARVLVFFVSLISDSAFLILMGAVKGVEFSFVSFFPVVVLQAAADVLLFPMTCTAVSRFESYLYGRNDYACTFGGGRL